MTVQDSFINNCAIGLPTMFDLPMTTAFFPTRSILRPFNIKRHPYGVQGISRFSSLWLAIDNFPTLKG